MKSPIEKKLRNALLSNAESFDIEIVDYSDCPLVDIGEYDQASQSVCVHTDQHHRDPECYGNPDGDQWALYSNVQILSYKIDLLLTGVSWPGVVAIECDGHDFHEKTKQQAAYDKSRDRELAAIGMTTLRCTGSEIHHSAERCVADVFGVLKRIGMLGQKDWCHRYDGMSSARQLAKYGCTRAPGMLWDERTWDCGSLAVFGIMSGIV